MAYPGGGLRPAVDCNRLMMMMILSEKMILKTCVVFRYFFFFVSEPDSRVYQVLLGLPISNFSVAVTELRFVPRRWQ